MNIKHRTSGTESGPFHILPFSVKPHRQAEYIRILIRRKCFNPSADYHSLLNISAKQAEGFKNQILQQGPAMFLESRWKVQPRGAFPKSAIGEPNPGTEFPIPAFGRPKGSFAASSSTARGSPGQSPFLPRHTFKIEVQLYRLEE